ncbi:MAG: hypothetical protein OXH61_02395 [Acidimicrobiaceae bacterium]|nr:hypothetical protein [Acidimicrobiaceae bacterium]
MDLDAIVQLVTVAMAAMGIVWHQQHNTDKLRGELSEDHAKLRDAIAHNGERLVRIEGFLGIGMPSVPDEAIDPQGGSRFDG